MTRALPSPVSLLLLISSFLPSRTSTSVLRLIETNLIRNLCPNGPFHSFEHDPRQTDKKTKLQWNPDLTNYQGTEEMRSLYPGFVKSKTSINPICMKIIKMFVISK